MESISVALGCFLHVHVLIMRRMMLSTCSCCWWRAAQSAQSYGCTAAAQFFITSLSCITKTQRSNIAPGMFNTVSNEWTPLISAKVQQPNRDPSPRWGHGCALLPAAGKDSPLAVNLHVFGSTSIDSVCPRFVALISNNFYC